MAAARTLAPAPTESMNRKWVEQEFGKVSLGDDRLNQALIESATAMADKPSATNPQRMDWNELRSFYGVAHAQRAQPHILQEHHRQQTRQRMIACPNRVLNVHDTTEIDFTEHTALHPHLGPIGRGNRLGLLQHNSLAFDPEGKQMLGLIYQQVTRRQARPPGETSRQRDLRPHKESELWLHGIRGVGRTPQGCRWIDVGDRGLDFFEAMQESHQQDHEFLIRIRHDRQVQVPAGVDEQTHEVIEELRTIDTTMSGMASVTTKSVEVASRGGRPGRSVLVQVGYRSDCWLQPPQPNGIRRGLLPLKVTLIRVWEPEVDALRTDATRLKAAAKQTKTEADQTQAESVQAKSDAAKALAKAKRSKVGSVKSEAVEAQAKAEVAAEKAVAEKAKAEVAKTQAAEAVAKVGELLDWWLVTNSPVGSKEDVLRAVSDYEWRWAVAEEYHKAEKSGLRIESQRFESYEPLVATMAVISVVAIRLLQLRYARDSHPDCDASMVASEVEIEVVGKATRYTGKRMTVKAFVDRVARLGGYLGRKCDGPPGWMTLWRGYQRLRDMLLGIELLREHVDPQPQAQPPPRT
jgi:hypothetical protein